jgi:hypothetical protein
MEYIQEIKKRITCPEVLSRHGIYVRSGGRCISPLRAGAHREERNP